MEKGRNCFKPIPDADIGHVTDHVTNNLLQISHENKVTHLTDKTNWFVLRLRVIYSKQFLFVYSLVPY